MPTRTGTMGTLRGAAAAAGALTPEDAGAAAAPAQLPLLPGDSVPPASGRGRFQMQSFHDNWEAMEDGAASRTWRRRDTAEEAVVKCLTWTGLIGIPAMQVVDLVTDRVVWRYGHPVHSADAGDPIALPDEDRIRRQVRADLKRKTNETEA